ncbi:MAG: YncE family protein [Bacteroidetes bacterium]|jgi:DNA-binding beta-propeller fold protein YncE|nr:YncE family protein [Bacteroidota bacterium]
MRSHFVLVILMLFAALLLPGNANAQTYKLYVAAESEDMVYLISFDADTETGSVQKEIPVGAYPTETEGPHGMNVSPDGRYWYLSMGHGMPYGHLYKYETGTDRLVTREELGMFPATLDISKRTGLIYVVNFNLHGDHEPSTVSVVDGESMTEIEQIETGIMPHGARLNSEGILLYHASMMTDELVEIDAMDLQVSRTLKLTEGESSSHHQHNGMHHEGSEMEMANPVAKPTWASPHPVKPEIYVAGNGDNKIYVIDSEIWEVKAVWDTPAAGPYNLEPTHDGELLVVTYKSDGSTGIWNIEKEQSLAVIPNSRPVSHGVVISPDNRYAFISVEGVGGEPGSVDIINLENRQLVDVVEIGKQASGITFWKTEPKR